MNPLPLAWSALRRNAVGSLAVVALVAVAGALAVIASAEERAFRAASTRAAERFDLIVGAPGGATQLVLTTVFLQPAALDLLPASTLQRVASEPGVERVAPIAVTDSYAGHVIVATTPEFALERGVAEGRAPVALNEALVGADVPLALGVRFIPQHGAPHENLLEAHDHDLALTVVGRAARNGTPWDRAIVVRIETAWALHDEAHPDHLGPPWPAARVPAIVVHPKTVADAYRLRMKYRGDGTTAVFPAEALVPLYRLLGDARDLASAMALAFETLVLLAVTLAMLAALAAQRGSLGALRALGAPPRFVFAVIWTQGAALIAAGALIAAIAGLALIHVVSAVASARSGLRIEAALGMPEVAMLALPLVGGATLIALAALVVLRAPVGAVLRDA